MIKVQERIKKKLKKYVEKYSKIINNYDVKKEKKFKRSIKCCF